MEELHNDWGGNFVDELNLIRLGVFGLNDNIWSLRVHQRRKDNIHVENDVTNWSWETCWIDRVWDNGARCRALILASWHAWEMTAAAIRRRGTSLGQFLWSKEFTVIGAVLEGLGAGHEAGECD